MKNPLTYCLAIVLFISGSASVQAQTKKPKKKHAPAHRTTHRTAHKAPYKTESPIHYRPAGWNSSRAAYTRRPILWEGYKYYTYHPYYAFPYKPAMSLDTVPIRVGDETYFYFSGKFYTPVPEQNGYQVVKAPAGAYVFDLPAGCTEVHAGSVVFLQYNGDYYLPVMIGKRVGYEVANVEAMPPQY